MTILREPLLALIYIYDGPNHHRSWPELAHFELEHDEAYLTLLLSLKREPTLLIEPHGLTLAIPHPSVFLECLITLYEASVK